MAFGNHHPFPVAALKAGLFDLGWMVALVKAESVRKGLLDCFYLREIRLTERRVSNVALRGVEWPLTGLNGFSPCVIRDGESVRFSSVLEFEK